MRAAARCYITPQASLRPEATLRKALLTFVLVLTSATASAAVYRWVDDTGAVHYGDSVPEAHKNKAKPISVAPSPTEAERAAAEDRRAHDKSLAEAARKAQETAQGKTATLPPPASAGAGGKRTCEQEWQAWEQSAACFAPFRNASGGIRAEAFKKCTELPAPKCNRPAK